MYKVSERKKFMIQKTIETCIMFTFTFLIGFSSADITLLNKYAHKTHFSLEQVVFKADCILVVKKKSAFTTEKILLPEKNSKCPLYKVIFYNFTIKDILKGNVGFKGQQIRVKEPFSDLAYTVHYSYYTRGFVIEPFVGEYTPSISMDTTDSMIIFLNTAKGKANSETVYQFSVINSFESEGKRDEVKKILNRPKGDMKRLFLRK